MDVKQLDDWEALAKAATEGPWVARQDKKRPDRCLGIHIEGKLWDEVVTTDSGIYGPDMPTAAFIAAARAAVPALVEEVRRLRARQVPFELDLRIGGWVPAKEAQTEARRSERERCAKVADAEADAESLTPPRSTVAMATAERIADSIRALPDEPSPEET